MKKHNDFLQLFYENLTKSVSSAPMQEAYELTEQSIIEIEGRRRFANYKVFRVIKSRHSNIKMKLVNSQSKTC